MLRRKVTDSCQDLCIENDLSWQITYVNMLCTTQTVTSLLRYLQICRIDLVGSDIEPTNSCPASTGEKVSSIRCCPTSTAWTPKIFQELGGLAACNLKQ